MRISYKERETPAISVVMSTYNEKERFLRMAIESILNQTFSDFEFLIGVDKPENASLTRILNEYEGRDGRIRIIINEKNIGLAKTLNKLIELAQGKYIARMDADDYSEPERFEKQLGFMRRHEADLVSCDVKVIDENDNVIQRMNHLPSSDKKIRRVLKCNNCVPHPAWMVRRQVYLDLGGYEETPFCEDYELLLKARMRQYRFGNVNEALLCYRMTTVSISRSNIYKQYLAMKYCQEKYVKRSAVSWESFMQDRYDAGEEKRYQLSAQRFTEGLSEARKGHMINAVTLLFRAYFGSKCYRDKIRKYLYQVI